jgi:hypothetical protein
MSGDDLRNRIRNRMEEIVGESRMETMTRSQLTAAIKRMDRNREAPIKFGEYWSAESLAANLFAHKGAPTVETTLFNANETLTVAELDNALRDLKYTGGVHANELYRRVVANREPVWKTGDIVRSDAGNVFVRRADGDWEDLPGRRTHGLQPNVVKDTTITRPLTLVGRAV